MAKRLFAMVETFVIMNCFEKSYRTRNSLYDGVRFNYSSSAVKDQGQAFNVSTDSHLQHRARIDKTGCFHPTSDGTLDFTPLHMKILPHDATLFAACTAGHGVSHW